MTFLYLSFSLVSLALGAATTFAEDVWDPAEGVNRGIFKFNDKVDIYFMEPVARGYDKVVPQPAKKGVSNFFRNLRYPSYLVSDIVQLKFGQAAHHTGRFLINTTIGLFGFIDVAQHVGLEDQKEDFGIALAYHGVPAGPYMVLPILGPSNLRDSVGLLVDFFLDPFTILSLSSVKAGTSDPIVYSASGMKLVDTRAGLLDAIESAKTGSVDYYLFTQSAYYQYRDGLLYDKKDADTNAETLLDDDDELPDGGASKKENKDASEKPSASNE